MRGDKRKNIIDVLYYSPEGVMVGFTAYEIGKKIGASPQYVGRVLKDLHLQGMVAYLETPYRNTKRVFWTTTSKAKRANKERWSDQWVINKNALRQMELPL
jgi:DNA-binding MarR family transcriptional regulator